MDKRHVLVVYVDCSEEGNQQIITIEQSCCGQQSAEILATNLEKTEKILHNFKRNMPSAKNFANGDEETTLQRIQRTVRQKFMTQVIRTIEDQTSIDLSKRTNRRSWLLLLMLITVIGVLHMLLLLQVALVEPTNVNIAFVTEEKLQMPRIHICQEMNRFLDPDKLRHANITAEQYYALELGVGFLDFFDSYPYTELDLELVRWEYAEAVRQHGNILNAFLDFRKRFAYTCEQVFIDCNWLPSAPAKGMPKTCCEVFELVYSIDSICFVSREASVFIETAAVLGTFHFRLNRFRKKEKFEFLFGDDRAIPTRYNIDISDELRQTPHVYWGAPIISLRETGVEINLIQSARELMPIKGNCVHRSQTRLASFREYGMTNCVVQHLYLDNFRSMAGVPCTLPLFQLMSGLDHQKWEQTAADWCSLQVIFDLIGLHRLIDPIMIAFPPADTLNETDELDEYSLEFLKDKCRPRGIKPGMNNRKPMCTPEFLESLNISVAPENLKSLLNSSRNFHHLAEPYFNTAPSLLLAVFQKYRLESISDASTPAVDLSRSCLPLCMSHSHLRTITKGKRTREAESAIWVTFGSSQVQRTVEVPRLHWSEYLGLVGGNIGMWNGCSVVSLIHLAILFVYWFRRRLPSVQ